MTSPDQYNKQVPQPKDTIASSQEPFLANFAQLFNAFDNDHVPLNAASNAGNHNVARMFQQNNPLTTSVSEIALYSKGRKYQTDQLFFREQGNQLEFQYSNYQIFPLAPVVVGGVTTQIPFFTFLPGNILVYFGRVNPTGFKFNLLLFPDICKVISSANFCVINQTKRYCPIIGLTTNKDGLANVMTLENADGFATTIPNLYYIIFGNPVT